MRYPQLFSETVNERICLTSTEIEKERERERERGGNGWRYWRKKHKTLITEKNKTSDSKPNRTLDTIREGYMCVCHCDLRCPNCFSFVSSAQPNHVIWGAPIAFLLFLLHSQTMWNNQVSNNNLCSSSSVLSLQFLSFFFSSND